MLNLLSLFRKDKIWDFDGGIHPPEMKTQSNGTPLRQLPLADRYIIPLKQHIGHEGELCVQPGDHLLRGQPLTFGNGRMLPVHAPTSGTVTAIAPHMTAHPSGLTETCVFITPDGDDRWIERETISDYRQLSREEVVTRIHQAGVAGLGGAGFPTATKLKGGLRGINTLIINAAECEPYITADDRLMQDYAAEVLEGCRILGWVLQAERVLIGIEDNKPQAIAALRQALGKESDLAIRVVPTKYPSGGAKQLTKILTGKEVPHGGRSTDIGVLMQNVGTAWAVKRAIIDGEPITERVVTLTGEAIARPANVWGRLGTPVSHLLREVGFKPGKNQMVIMGGPLMGFTLPALDVPIVKISNCILAPSASEMGEELEEQSCIRCSACADACPANLLPQQLFWYSQGGDHDKARAHHIDDCIECGACAYVCPSNIPLVQYYRQEKAELRAIDLEAQRTAEAKARFEARQTRLEREKLAREARHEQAKRKVSASQQTQIDAARERVYDKNRAADETDALNAAALAEQKARHAQALVEQAEQQMETEPVTRQAVDPRKAAVEAAIARAKAKQASAAVASESANNHASPAARAARVDKVGVDPRKAAVEAAIARAKAKKAAQDGDAVPDAASADAEQSTDPRKAAVEAAIARAKAKKAAQAAASDAEPQQATDVAENPQADAPAVDPRKAAVEAAIARAKAKKAAQAAASDAEPQQATDVAENPQADAPVADPRKAAVEAAIARAKAKKAAQAAASDAEPQQAADVVNEAQADAPEAAPAADPRRAAIDAAIARAKAKKAAQAAASDAEPQQAADVVNEAQANAPEAAPAADPRRAAIDAAIARAKAKKAAQAAASDAEPQQAADVVNEAQADAPEAAPAADPRRAAIDAAIARAKAKKAAQAAASDAEPQQAADVVNEAQADAPETAPAADPRKAAVEAAIARAKAKKAAQAAASDAEPQQAADVVNEAQADAPEAAPAADPRRAAIDAAIARAKAKKAAQAAADNNEEETLDPRKAAIAAAIARAKAKKAQQHNRSED
ncbi:electron transport complex subunit RsxC [Duffyella gerundensis]|uniref:electron transport complex subunit RsxC n=1 Tax=Duffyella gerundensis TaxID=1619313 RepID=UPI0021F7B5A2|nr:electron transport complex subunit RsxC [Duffyella gerundensis]